MTKDDIKNATIAIFGRDLKKGRDYDELSPSKDPFNGYSSACLRPLSSPSPLCSSNQKFFYLACNGGYEQEFNGDLSFHLHCSLNRTNPNYFVLRERTCHSPSPLIGAKGTDVYRSRVDIVSGDITSIHSSPTGFPFRDFAAIMLGHNYICQSSAVPTPLTRYPNFLQKVVSELSNLSTLGFKKSFFVALLSDIDIHDQTPSSLQYNKYSGKIKNRNQIKDNVYNYVAAINDYRKAFYKIDQDFVHLIFRTKSLPGYNNADIYLNIFIIEKQCDFIIKKTDGKSIVEKVCCQHRV